MPDASPTKWHLAHTAWFFETFVLAAAIPGYRPRYPQYNYLFNSYYNAVGERISRDKRGLMSRPSIGEVQRYRQEIDTLMEDWFARPTRRPSPRLAPVIVLGLNHEQQHQELILTDLKHAFGSNPLRPIYLDRAPTPPIPRPADLDRVLRGGPLGRPRGAGVTPSTTRGRATASSSGRSAWRTA